MKIKEIFFNNGKAYVILRSLPQHNVTRKDGTIDAELFNAWKTYLGADHVLRTSEDFLYCETIPDVEWEDILASPLEGPTNC
jgi:hypothetical protein